MRGNTHKEEIMQEIQIMLAIITVCIFYICVVLTMINANIENKPTHREIPNEIKTSHKAKIKPTEETDEQRQYNTLLSNIDNYDGTGKNQKEVR